MLKELTLSQYGEANPVCELSTYRSSVLATLKKLEVLDGLDRTGKPAATRDDVFSIPGTILYYLTSVWKVIGSTPVGRTQNSIIISCYF